MVKLKKPVIFLLIFLSNLITYQNKYDSLMNNIKNAAISKEAVLNRHIDLIRGYADIISVFGNSFFLGAGIKDSRYYNLLQYDTELDYYHMDAIAGTRIEKTEGNLTGTGQIPAEGIQRDELYLALHFNNIFNKLYDKLPDILWLNYISENNFINRYPFVLSKDFRYTMKLKESSSYIKAVPENNKSRQSVWTPVYLNQAGTELIISYAVPIYNRNTFMGVVSFDFTNLRFSEMIDSNYESYLIDENDSVMASGHLHKLGKQVIPLNKFLDISHDTVNTMKQMKVNEVKRIGNYYVYAIRLTNAPWRLFIRVPAWSILLQSLVTTLPIMLICFFLLLALNEVEKRRKTERLLKDSITELKSYQKLLESAAEMDFLTTTYNRRGFKEKLNENMIKNKSGQIPITILLGDIDYFKQYNDTYGHAAGDKVLIRAADIMKKNVKKNDIVCRWGGEEFLIMLLNKTYEEALEIAEKIRKEIETTVIKIEESVELKVTITIGVSEYDEEDGFDHCISKADRALYAGKELGKNRVMGSRD